MNVTLSANLNKKLLQNIIQNIMQAKNVKFLPMHIPEIKITPPVVDIYSKAPYPGGILSNFKRCSFVLDDIQCASIEGVLQSLKVIIPSKQENLALWQERMDLQKKICSFANSKAKRNGNFLNLFNPEKKLSWRGNLINRWSEEYQTFLKRVFEARYKADEEYRQAIFDTKNCILTHSVGKHDKSETILTVEEFIGMLNYLKDKFINNYK